MNPNRRPSLAYRTLLFVLAVDAQQWPSPRAIGPTTGEIIRTALGLPVVKAGS